MAASNGNDTDTDTGINMRITDYPHSWDNPDLLDRYYNELDYSTEEIAKDVFDGDVSRETVRKRLHQFDLMPVDGSNSPGSNSFVNPKLLLSLNKDDVGEDTPEGDDTFKDYTKAGRGGSDAN